MTVVGVNFAHFVVFYIEIIKGFFFVNFVLFCEIFVTVVDF